MGLCIHSSDYMGRARSWLELRENLAVVPIAYTTSPQPAVSFSCGILNGQRLKCRDRQCSEGPRRFPFEGPGMAGSVWPLLYRLYSTKPSSITFQAATPYRKRFLVRWARGPFSQGPSDPGPQTDTHCLLHVCTSPPVPSPGSLWHIHVAYRRIATCRRVASHRNFPDKTNTEPRFHQPRPKSLLADDSSGWPSRIWPTERTTHQHPKSRYNGETCLRVSS